MPSFFAATPARSRAGGGSSLGGGGAALNNVPLLEEDIDFRVRDRLVTVKLNTGVRSIQLILGPKYVNDALAYADFPFLNWHVSEPPKKKFRENRETFGAESRCTGIEDWH